VDVTAWRCRPEGMGNTVPIGSAVANTQMYILDRQGEPAPVGVVGELYIGGVQVGRGYLNRPELTAERFIPDPFEPGGGSRMYKTGDLGRWTPEGTIEFLGRNDFQVKIRGFRIELGEIEARLAEHEAIREAVVLAREDAGEEKRLVAYYTCVQGDDGEAESPEVEKLRRHMAAKLPEYMVPAAYVRLDTLPLTPNGKLDRRALPGPEEGAYAARGYEAPVGETETAIAGIWAQALKVERIGRYDNFFDLGGHSLLVVQVVARVRQQLNVEVTIGDLFAQPILTSFAELTINRQLEQIDPAKLAGVFKLMRSSHLN
jgi:hypothetical protein